ncbi:MAG: division/cell wall cluster transcriptional repressor MraZ [Oscillospiraceae bacterium]|jgi:MraZ protein|nr:division/cell wall cluster transcriptional repressor MraZ [Oscillospiraceae bacterium]
MVNVFAGTHAHTLDKKGRAIIPAAFRDKLSAGFTIALNSSIEALAIYPLEKWEAINEQLSRVRDTDEEGMDYVRFVMSNAMIGLELDGQGRILLPQLLRDMANIDDEALTFVGMRDHIEVWSSKAFAEKKRLAREQFAQLRKHVNDTY